MKRSLKMVKGARNIIVLGIVVALCNVVEAGPPLPLHCIEGTSGVHITSTAYLANPPAEGEVFGKPSISISSIFGREKNLQSFAITENILGNFEIGYAYQRFGLGDWPDNVKTATGLRVDQHLGLHIFNLRTMVIQEGGLDCSWMPAITFGTHFKWNEGQTKLDEDLGGLLDTLGSDHSSGTEFTVVASKTVVDLLPRPIILSAGIRNGDAIHTGLFGFAGERRTTFEGSILFLLTDRLIFAAEYRQKPDLMNQLTAGGQHLIKAENDWMSLYLAYVINDNLTISGGYANLGNVADSRENNAFGIQLKYEF